MLNKFELTVKAFIDLLEIVEETDNGREFHPNYISSCRASDASKMLQLIEEMKQHLAEQVDGMNEAY